MSEFLVERLGPQGDGIVSTSDGETFCPFTLPGERISGEPIENRISNAKIIEPVSDRIKAACRHFKTCGGCNLQHASDSLLEDWKTTKTKDALKSVGLHPEFRQIKTSQPHSRRRATFTAKRTKKGAMVGFHGRASDTIVEVTECPVSDPLLLSAFSTFKDFVKIGGSRKGTIRIATTVSATGLDVQVSDAKDVSPTEISLLAQLCKAAKICRLVWNSEMIAMESPPIQSFDGIEVSPPSGAFLQATKDGEDTLIKTVKEIVGPAKATVDLFSGCGTFTLPLAKTSEISAFESDEDMISSLNTAWRSSTGLKDVVSSSRDLFRRPLLPDELNKFDAIVIDPPRAGATAQVCEIAKSIVKKIAFVSCNPSTFSRDAKILVDAGYSLDWVQVVDQFKWNPHVELVAQFTKV